MALPPFVIVHGKRTNGVDAKGKVKPYFLTVNGWSPLRDQAVSCNSNEEAKAWLDESLRQTPRIFVGAEPRVERQEDETSTPYGGAMVSEYDPYAERM